MGVDVKISIHAPARGQTKRFFQKKQKNFISIHAPARGQTCILGRSHSAELFQFTPPRGGKPVGRYDHNGRPKISIHAPARGQTNGADLILETVENFNSRPREGAN